MLGIIKKQGVKYSVFAINILLAAIAVLIIREKDQARLLSNAQKTNSGSGSASDNALPSFKSSVTVEEPDGTVAPIQVPPVDSEAVAPAEPLPQNIVPVSPTIPVPAAPSPSPVPQMKPANAQTKTS